MHIEPITVDAFFDHPGSPALLDGYARECANADLPPYRPDRDAYARMEQSGAMHLLASFEGEQLTGVLVLLVYLNPHCSLTLAVTESWFVLPEYRATGAGLALYRRAKRTATERGAVAIYVSAPTGGPLAGVMQGLGAVETSRVFCEVLQ